MIDLPVISYTMALLWHYSNDDIVSTLFQKLVRRRQQPTPLPQPPPLPAAHVSAVGATLHAVDQHTNVKKD